MPATLQTIQAGRAFRPSASTWNALVAGERADQALRRRFGAGEFGKSELRTTVVLVKNASGAQVPKFGVLGIDGPAIGPDENPLDFMHNIVLSGVEPDPAAHAKSFVVLAEPLPADSIGRAFIAGTFWCKLNVVTEADTFAAVKADTAELESAGTGPAVLLWKEPGTGAGKWALVLITGGVGEAQRLRITGNRTCGGAYAALLTITATAAFNTGASTFDDTAIATDTATEVTFVNLSEQGETTHVITASPQEVDFVWGFRAGVDDAGRPKYEGNIVIAKDCVAP